MRPAPARSAGRIAAAWGLVLGVAACDADVVGPAEPIAPEAPPSSAAEPDPRLAAARAYTDARRWPEAAALYRAMLLESERDPATRSAACLAYVDSWLARESAADVRAACRPGSVPEGAPDAERHARVEAYAALRARRDARALVACARSDGADATTAAAFASRLDALDARDRAACEAQGAGAAIDTESAVFAGEPCALASNPEIAHAIDARMGLPPPRVPGLADLAVPAQAAPAP